MEVSTTLHGVTSQKTAFSQAFQKAARPRGVSLSHVRSAIRYITSLLNYAGILQLVSIALKKTFLSVCGLRSKFESRSYSERVAKQLLA
jgi:hypothetical protein